MELSEDMFCVMAKIMNEFEHKGKTKVLEKAFTQYTLSKAEKKFGKKGFDTGFKEFDQLHKKSVLQPKKVSELSEEEKKKVLESLIFIKEKRDGTLKGRTCANGRKQCGHVKKEDAASPTVSLETVLLTCVMEAKEERDIAIIDILNAFV